VHEDSRSLGVSFDVGHGQGDFSSVTVISVSSLPFPAYDLERFSSMNTVYDFFLPFLSLFLGTP